MKPSGEIPSTKVWWPPALVGMAAELFEHADALCHGSMVDQMVHDAIRNREYAKEICPFAEPGFLSATDAEA